MSHLPGSPVDGPDEIRSKFLTFATHWKSITGFLGGLVLLGWGVHAYASSLATQTDVAHEAGQRLDLGAEVRKAIDRLDVLDEGNKWRDATLKGIADRLGVYAPPPPSSMP